MPYQKKYFIGLCGIAKDENKYIKEWVAYHHYIGFEKIYIYDNESSRPLFNELVDYLKREICDIYRIKGFGVQNKAYNHCLQNYGHECEWMAFFDIDEFLCLKNDDDIRTAMIDYEEYSGLSIQWDVFSSSGHISRPSGFVTLNYQQSLGYKTISKCIVKPELVDMTFTSHHFIFKEGISVNPDEEPAIGAYAPIAVDKICLNHYMYRSQEDFAEKLNKSDATYGEKNPRSWAGFYNQAKSHTVQHEDIVKVAQSVLHNMQSHKYEQKYDVRLSDAQIYDIDKILIYLAKIINSKNLGLAEVVFALCFKKFSDNEDFLNLGFQIALHQKKYDRAKKIIDFWMKHHPSKEAYLSYFTYLLCINDMDNAKKIYEFISESSVHLEDASLRSKLKQIADRHGFSLSACS